MKASVTVPYVGAAFTISPVVFGPSITRIMRRPAISDTLITHATIATVVLLCVSVAMGSSSVATTVVTCLVTTSALALLAYATMKNYGMLRVALSLLVIVGFGALTYSDAAKDIEDAPDECLRDADSVLDLLTAPFCTMRKTSSGFAEMTTVGASVSFVAIIYIALGLFVHFRRR
jgi:hypothetical protein